MRISPTFRIPLRGPKAAGFSVDAAAKASGETQHLSIERRIARRRRWTRQHDLIESKAMTLSPLFDPADFRIPPGIAHVCAGGETAFLRSHDIALLRYAADKSLGMPGRTAQEAQVERARAGLARLWGAGTGDIGFVSNVAEGVSIVAESLDWRDGDNICIDPHEYPSVAGPFAMRQDVSLRIARGREPERLAAMADERTRIIAVSYVSYLTGERADLASLRQAADRCGALLLMDFTQAAGYLPIGAEVADFAFSACYKWLLGMTGVAAAYWNRARQPHWSPRSAGWHSVAPGSVGYETVPALRDDAMRFTRGNPAHGPVYVLANALDYLSQFDPATVQRHVQGLTVSLLARLRELQIPATTPPDLARHGASVCVASPRAQAIVDALHEQGVWAWNGHGRIRFSFHGYNAMADVDRIAEVLRPVW
jgi:cysteine desulfurase / selenocysteine lyase